MCADTRVHALEMVAVALGSALTHWQKGHSLAFWEPWAWGSGGQAGRLLGMGHLAGHMWVTCQLCSVSQGQLWLKRRHSTWGTRL